MDKTAISLFQNKLLNWYDSHARVLPWRDNPTPYRVWVSEIMLQQTRVDTVKPYFERFVAAVPDIEDLANLPDEQLLKLWEGLGYYSRAKNLKKAAGVVIEQFSGRMPTDAKGLQLLPGIGPYTSGAIASIAFGERVPAIDGNVLRVIARITANQGDITDKKVQKEIGDLVWQLLPNNRVGDFNQALMELGATICLPNGQPKCNECPVQGLCMGHQKGIAAELPTKTKKKARKIEKKTVFVIEHEGHYAIRQRPEEGLLSSLWELPNIEGHLSPKECEAQLSKWGIGFCEIVPLEASKHIFTHLEWHMIGYKVTASNKAENQKLIWVTRNKIKEQYSIPTAFKVYSNIIKKNSGGE